MTDERERVARELGRLDSDYLGDGVYVWHDGSGQIWLTTGHHLNAPLVALEPDVLRALDGYRKRVGIGAPK